MEELAVEQFVPELRIEALAIAVLPRTPGFDVCSPGADGDDPVRYRLGQELRAILGPYVNRHAAQDE